MRGRGCQIVFWAYGDVSNRHQEVMVVLLAYAVFQNSDRFWEHATGKRDLRGVKSKAVFTAE